ncbi:hypothetical protein HanPSC8_Chr14g0628361 [Helianthus annuus]|nr:hypothetical protein HanPSC8_Chr14g0628361 [Helianthus annuus]
MINRYYLAQHLRKKVINHVEDDKQQTRSPEEFKETIGTTTAIKIQFLSYISGTYIIL